MDVFPSTHISVTVIGKTLPIYRFGRLKAVDDGKNKKRKSRAQIGYYKNAQRCKRPITYAHQRNIVFSAELIIANVLSIFRMLSMLWGAVV